MTEKHWKLIIFAIVMLMTIYQKSKWEKDKEKKKDTEESSPFSKPSYVFSPIVSVGIILLVASIIVLFFF